MSVHTGDNRTMVQRPTISLIYNHSAHGDYCCTSMNYQVATLNTTRCLVISTTLLGECVEQNLAVELEKLLRTWRGGGYAGNIINININIINKKQAACGAAVRVCTAALKGTLTTVTDPKKRCLLLPLLLGAAGLNAI